MTDIEYERIEELAGSRELRDHVAEKLDALPVDQREAVRLRVVEEQDYRTLVEPLDISQDTARARVSRGLQALRAAIDAATAEHSISRGAPTMPDATDRFEHLPILQEVRDELIAAAHRQEANRRRCGRRAFVAVAPA